MHTRVDQGCPTAGLTLCPVAVLVVTIQTCIRDGGGTLCEAQRHSDVSAVRSKGCGVYAVPCAA